VVKNGNGKYFFLKNVDSELTFCNLFGVGVPRNFLNVKTGSAGTSTDEKR